MENKSGPTFGNGKICYLEIPARNIEESARFYQEVFGWRIRKDNSGNTSFDDGVGEVSGMWVLSRKPSTEPGLLVSIMVDDLTRTMSLVLRHGGKNEGDSMGLSAGEKIARFSDPTGNIFCLYQCGH